VDAVRVEGRVWRTATASGRGVTINVTRVGAVRRERIVRHYQPFVWLRANRSVGRRRPGPRLIRRSCRPVRFSRQISLQGAEIRRENHLRQPVSHP
jgi:hypothetical protein